MLMSRGWTFTCVTASALPGRGWSIQEYNKKYTSANAVVDTERTGSYTGDKVHLIDEGYVFDLGNCKFEVVHLPGHEDAIHPDL